MPRLLKPGKLKIACITDSLNDEEYLDDITKEMRLTKEIIAVDKLKYPLISSPRIVALLGVHKLQSAVLLNIKHRLWDAGKGTTPYGVVIAGHHAQREVYRKFLNPSLDTTDKNIFQATGIMFEINPNVLARLTIEFQHKIVELPKPWLPAIVWSILRFEFSCLRQSDQKKFMQEVNPALICRYRARSYDTGLFVGHFEKMIATNSLVKQWAEEYNIVSIGSYYESALKWFEKKYPYIKN